MPETLRELDSDLLPYLLEEVEELVGPKGVTEYVERAIRNELRWGPDRHAFPRDFVLTKDRDAKELLARWLVTVRGLVGPARTAEYVEGAIRKELDWGSGLMGLLMDDHELAIGPPSDAEFAEAAERMREVKPEWLAG